MVPDPPSAPAMRSERTLAQVSFRAISQTLPPAIWLFEPCKADGAGPPWRPRLPPGTPTWLEPALESFLAQQSFAQEFLHLPAKPVADGNAEAHLWAIEILRRN